MMTEYVSKRIFTLLVIFLNSFCFIPTCFANQECVILVHALARTHLSMLSMASTLKQHDFIVVNQSYPSSKKPILELANQYIPAMIEECLTHNPDHISFVTHSLGGIILQTWLQTHDIPRLHRIVMLSPPNHGSPMVNWLKDNPLFQVITGQAGQELEARPLNQEMTPLSHRYPIGVIAGSYSLNPFGALIFHEQNDGAVSVSSATTQNMSDFIVLPVSHTFMVMNPMVKNQVLYFLQFGKFIHPTQEQGIQHA